MIDTIPNMISVKSRRTTGSKLIDDITEDFYCTLFTVYMAEEYSFGAEKQDCGGGLHKVYSALETVSHARLTITKYIDPERLWCVLTYLDTDTFQWWTELKKNITNCILEIQNYRLCQNVLWP